MEPEATEDDEAALAAEASDARDDGRKNGSDDGAAVSLVADDTRASGEVGRGGVGVGQRDVDEVVAVARPEAVANEGTYGDVLSSIVNARGGSGGGGVAVPFRLTKGDEVETERETERGRTMARALLRLDGEVAAPTSASNSAATAIAALSLVAVATLPLPAIALVKDAGSLPHISRIPAMLPPALLLPSAMAAMPLPLPLPESTLRLTHPGSIQSVHLSYGIARYSALQRIETGRLHCFAASSRMLSVPVLDDGLLLAAKLRYADPLSGSCGCQCPV